MTITNEKVVSIRAQEKTYPATCTSLEQACALAKLVRQFGVDVEIIQLEDELFVLERAA